MVFLCHQALHYTLLIKGAVEILQEEKVFTSWFQWAQWAVSWKTRGSPDPIPAVRPASSSPGSWRADGFWVSLVRHGLGRVFPRMVQGRFLVSSISTVLWWHPWHSVSHGRTSYNKVCISALGKDLFLEFFEFLKVIIFLISSIPMFFRVPFTY